MNLGFDSKRLFCNFTGLGNYSRTLVKNLQQLYPNLTYNLYSPELRSSPETEAFHKSSNFKSHIAKTIFKSYWRSFSIVKQLKKDKIELYHGLSNEIPIGLKNTKIATVVTIHDLIFKTLPDTYPLMDRLIYNAKVKKSCRTADKIIAISQSTKKDLIKHYDINPDKIEVIYQSCNPIYYEAVEKKRNDPTLEKYGIPQKYLLYVGTIEKRKNLKVIIDAYEQLPVELRIPIVVVGRGKNYKKEMQLSVEEKGLSENIFWINGLKDNLHLRTVYQNALALIYPSYYEGLGLPVVEAMLCKTPVITSTTSSLPEAGGPGSEYFNPTDAKELAQIISKVITNKNHRESMIEIGYEYAHKMFSPEKLSKQLMECYQQTLQSKQRS